MLSTLRGAYGELWEPAGRLPFVALAGYRDGAALPEVTRIVADVTDYGATPDDKGSLDTQAFVEAIAYAKTVTSVDNPGVVYVPAGVYEIDKQLHINGSGIVLRGFSVMWEGPGIPYGEIPGSVLYKDVQ